MANFLSEFRVVLAKGEDLPTLPAVVVELQGVLDQELVSSGRIASIIERDPPLATRLLRMANSAAFSCGHPVADVDSAIRLLGLRQVRALCIALSVVSAFGDGEDSLVQPSFWHHSAGVAFMARELARCLNYTTVSSDELYMGGLLHDVGILVMDRYFPRKLRDVLQVAASCDSPLWMAENIVLSTEHGEIGGLLLERWALPASIVSMVSAHHNPQLAPQKYRDAAWLIASAETICGGLGPSLDIERLTEERALSFVETIRAAEYDVDTMLDRVGAATQEFSAALV